MTLSLENRKKKLKDRHILQKKTEKYLNSSLVGQGSLGMKNPFKLLRGATPAQIKAAAKQITQRLGF